MRHLVTVIVCSRAYGTDILGSDIDMKGVHVPDARDILLQRVPPSFKVRPGDHETHSLQRFLELLAEGQPQAIEMVCSPPSLWVGEPSREWLDLVANRASFLTRETTFVRYSAKQASSFQGRALRMSSVRAVLGAIKDTTANHVTAARVADVLEAAVALSMPGVSVVPDTGRKGSMLVVGDKNFGEAMPLAAVALALDAVLERFGARTARTTVAGGTDWKALMHAVRLAREAEEYHQTGLVSLPRPDAAWLTRVRLGEVDMVGVTDALEEATARAMAATEVSVLPEAGDFNLADEMVARTYGACVLGGMSATMDRFIS